MARRRKVKKGRLALVIIVGIAALLLIIFGIFSFARLVSNLFSDSNTHQTITQPITNEVAVENNDIKINLDNYKVYEDDTDRLGFNFVIGEFSFKSDSNIYFDLSKLQTSEKINLANVSDYTKKLSDNGYNVSNLNIQTGVIQSNENKYKCYLFIPYTTDSITLGVYNLIDTTRIDIDLTKNTNIVTSLKIGTEEQIVIDDTSISVSGCYQSDLMVHNDVPYNYPNSIKIYTFNLKVNSVDQSTNKIVSAKFVPNNSSETFVAMSSGYHDLSVDNIIDKELSPGDKYALFFEVFSSDDISYEGKLIIEFENNSQLVELSTVLQ